MGKKKASATSIKIQIKNDEKMMTDEKTATSSRYPVGL